MSVKQAALVTTGIFLVVGGWLTLTVLLPDPWGALLLFAPPALGVLGFIWVLVFDMFRKW